MMMKKFLLALLLAIGVSTPVLAQCVTQPNGTNTINNCAAATNLQPGDYVLGYQNAKGNNSKITIQQILNTIAITPIPGFHSTGSVIIDGGLTVNGSLDIGSFTISSLNDTPVGNVTPSTGVFSTLQSNGSTLFTLANGVAFAATGNGSVKVPAGTTGQRPSTGDVGEMRYNTTTAQWEFGAGGSWTNFLSGASVGFAVGQIPGLLTSVGGVPALQPSTELIFQRATAAVSDASDFRFRRSTTFTGGTSSNINKTMQVETGIGANDGAQNWGSLDKMSSLSTVGGIAVARYMQNVRSAGSNAWAWGAIVEMRDDTGLASAVVGNPTNSMEIDLTASDLDNATNPSKWGGLGNRHMFHIVGSRSSASPAVQNEISHMLWIGTTNSYIDSIIGADLGVGAAGSQTRQIVDARGFIAPTGVTDPVAAVRMGSSQIIDFNGGAALNSAPGNYLQYTTTGTTRLRYMAGATEAFSISNAGNITANFINNRPQFPGNGVVCNWNGTTGTDDTAAMNAALATFTAGTVAEIAPGKQCLIDSANLTIPDNVTLKGKAAPGQQNGATLAILTDGSGIVLNPLYTVMMGSGSELRSATVRRKDLIPSPSAAQVKTQVATWAAENSVGVTLPANKPGIVIDDVLVIGFNSCFKSSVGRFTLNSVAGDCVNGLDASHSGDIFSVNAARFEPYYRSGALSAGDAARPGAGFLFHDEGSAAMITNSFTFMYAYGLVAIESTAIWITNTAFEFHDSFGGGITDTTCVRLIGGSGNIWLNGASCSAFDRGFVNESNGGGNWWQNTVSQGNAGSNPTQYYLGAAPAANPPTFTWSGSFAAGEQITLTTTDGTNVPGSPLAVTYTIQSGDTAQSASEALAARFNTAWQLSKNYIRATAATTTGTITVQYPVAYTTGTFACSGTGGTTCSSGTGTASAGSTTMLSGVNPTSVGHIEVGIDAGSTNAVSSAIIANPWPVNTPPVGGWLQVGAGSLSRTKVYNFGPTGITSANLSACGTGPTIQSPGSTDAAGVVRTGTSAAGCVITFTTPYWTAPACSVSAIGDNGILQDFTVTATTLTVTLTTTARSTFAYQCAVNGPRMTGTYTFPGPAPAPSPSIQTGALTGTCCGGATTETIIGTIKIPGNSMGTKGSTALDCLYSYPNSANTKTFRWRLTTNSAGSTSGNLITTDASATTTTEAQTRLVMRNTSATSQITFGTTPLTPYGSNTGTPNALALDTTGDLYISVNGITASGSETITLQHCQAIIANVP